MFVSARVSHSLSPLHVPWSAGEKRGDRQKLDGQREGVMLKSIPSDIRRHAST